MKIKLFCDLYFPWQSLVCTATIHLHGWTQVICTVPNVLLLLPYFDFFCTHFCLAWCTFMFILCVWWLYLSDSNSPQIPSTFLSIIVNLCNIIYTSVVLCMLPVMVIILTFQIFLSSWFPFYISLAFAFILWSGPTTIIDCQFHFFFLIHDYQYLIMLALWGSSVCQNSRMF